VDQTSSTASPITRFPTRPNESRSLNHNPSTRTDTTGSGDESESQEKGTREVAGAYRVVAGGGARLETQGGATKKNSAQHKLYQLTI
jgi:hypothetical protein